MLRRIVFFFFFFNDTATTEIYTLSLHDALPISPLGISATGHDSRRSSTSTVAAHSLMAARSEEHTSELQSLRHLVCRLLLEKKKKLTNYRQIHKETNKTTKNEI